MTEIQDSAVRTEKPGVKRIGIGKLLLYALICVLLVVADLITKHAAEAALSDGPIVLIRGVLELRYTRNTGAAFGMLKGARILFSLIAAAAIAVIFVILSRTPDDRRMRPFRILLVLIAAGAAGNLIDRLLLGYVRDFIYFSLINFPIFNVADIYVTCATFLMVVAVLFYYRDEHDFDFLK